MVLGSAQLRIDFGPDVPRRSKKGVKWPDFEYMIDLPQYFYYCMRLFEMDPHTLFLRRAKSGPLQNKFPNSEEHSQAELWKVLPF